MVIYLAGSQQDQFRLCAKLVNPMWPLRVATLLQARDRSWSTWLVSLSDLRSFQSASPKWIETVTKFMNLVRLIIVDARSESEALGAEIETIKRESLQYKTIFVGDETTFSLQYLAQLSGDGSIEAQEFLKIEPSRLPSFVIFNFAVARLRPSPDRPLAKFHMTPVTELKRWAGRSLDDFDVRRVSSPRLE